MVELGVELVKPLSYCRIHLDELSFLHFLEQLAGNGSTVTVLLVLKVPLNSLLKGGIFGHPMRLMPVCIDRHTAPFLVFPGYNPLE